MLRSVLRVRFGVSVAVIASASTPVLAQAERGFTGRAVEAANEVSAADAGAGAGTDDEHGDSAISMRDRAIAVVDELKRPRHIREPFTVGTDR